LRRALARKAVVWPPLTLGLPVPVKRVILTLTGGEVRLVMLFTSSIGRSEVGG
jgi:hypothetical protein